MTQPGTEGAETEGAAAPAAPARNWLAKTAIKRAAIKYAVLAPLGLVVAGLLGLAGLDTPIGHRFLADWLAGQTAQNGLAVSIGRIDGSIYGKAQLQDVALRDPSGVFARVPQVDLDWQPLAWADHVLDVHRLDLKRGTLLRAPNLRPGNPNTPLLPSFDIRVGSLVIERLTVAPGVAGPARRVDLAAKLDIRKGRALIDLDSRLGGADRLKLLLDADEKAQHFALALDYNAPKGGLLAALTHAPASRLVRIDGRGGWASWRGGLIATQDRAPLASASLSNHAGALTAKGELSPALLAPPQLAAMLGAAVSAEATGRLIDGQLTGHLLATSPTLHADAKGTLDLHAARFADVTVDAVTRAALPLSDHSHLEGAVAHVVLSGPFGGLTARGGLKAAHWVQGNVTIENAAVDGSASLTDGHWRLPLTATAARVITGNASVDPRLIALKGSMVLAINGPQRASDNLVITAPGLALNAVLRGNEDKGGYALAGRLTARGIGLGKAGAADGDANGTVSWGRDGGWQLGARLSGRMARMDSAVLAKLTGTAPSFTADLRAAKGQPLLLPHAALTSEKLSLTLSGRALADGHTELSGAGHQDVYGAFTVAAVLGADGPHADFLFTDPLPAAGLRQVKLAVTPEGGGFALETSGTSLLGPFAGTLGLSLPDGAPARLTVRHFAASDTQVTGGLDLDAGGVDGQLALSGGGVSGAVRLSPRAQGPGQGGQGIDAHLTIHDAHFGGATPLTIAHGQMQASGLILRQHSSLTADAQLQGIGKGRLFIGRAAARLSLADGAGQMTASLAGRRGSRFELQLGANITPGRLGLAAGGVFSGATIATPRRAVLTQRSEADGGGWQLAPSEVDFGKGRAIASGVLGNGAGVLDLALADMPLALGDVVFADLGLGGTVTGLLHYGKAREAAPTGSVRMLVKGLTRSGLVLTSRPINLALAGELSAGALQLRSVASADGQTLGRVQARIGALPAAGTLVERLRGGTLSAGMRYAGPADALWRLMALDNFDLTGPVDIAADISGSLDDPRIKGSLASDNLRLQSAVSGTDISQISARGSFAESRLSLTSLAGHTAGGGLVSGSGTIDFSGITDGHGPGIDLRIAATRAAILGRSDMALTATGPMRIMSDGTQGTIAGRLRIDAARWRLGQAPAVAALPDIATREINRSADIAPASAHKLPWRFLVDAAGPGKIRVLGLGMDSEWGAAVRLRGSLEAPAIEGSADLVGGSYEFAGQHFDLTRGHIAFDGGSPPDPRLDIAATNSSNGLTATVTVRGTSLSPEIEFSSVPPLPEEELLSRLLFGTSVANISAPEAVQLGAALAALHGGGGLDPINVLRSAIGLDRLRIVSADPTVPHLTAVAVGKYVGHRVYAEVISDGKGYSATNLEFRITRWLSLLGSVSTINRHSVNARISHDY